MAIGFVIRVVLEYLRRLGFNVPDPSSCRLYQRRIDLMGAGSRAVADWAA